MATGKPTPIPIFAPVESPLGLGEGDVFGDVDEDIVAEIIVEIVAEIVAGEVMVFDRAVCVIAVGVIALPHDRDAITGHYRARRGRRPWWSADVTETVRCKGDICDGLAHGYGRAAQVPKLIQKVSAMGASVHPRRRL
jgi:hypothetical protein